MRKILAAAAFFSGSLALGGTALWAKGLDELHAANPDEAEAEGDDEGKAGAKSGEGKGEAVMEKGAASKAIADKLFMGTSFGWVFKAARSEGDWKGSGMSDITVGYKLLALGSKMDVAGTYRYAPMAVAGTVDNRSYRGVWESHFFGGRGTMQVAPSINAIGTAELGYVAVHMRDEDGLPAEDKVSKGGAELALGGGADFMISDKWACAAGPRAYLGVGSFTTFQLAAAASFLF